MSQVMIDNRIACAQSQLFDMRHVRLSIISYMCMHLHLLLKHMCIIGTTSADYRGPLHTDPAPDRVLCSSSLLLHGDSSLDVQRVRAVHYCEHRHRPDKQGGEVRVGV